MLASYRHYDPATLAQLRALVLQKLVRAERRRSIENESAAVVAELDTLLRELALIDHALADRAFQSVE